MFHVYDTVCLISQNSISTHFGQLIAKKYCVCTLRHMTTLPGLRSHREYFRKAPLMGYAVNTDFQHMLVNDSFKCIKSQHFKDKSVGCHAK